MKSVLFVVLCGAVGTFADIIADTSKILPVADTLTNTASLDDFTNILNQIPGLDALKSLSTLPALFSVFTTLLRNGGFSAMFAIILLIPVVVLVMLVVAFSVGPPPFPEIGLLLVKVLGLIIPGFDKLIPLITAAAGALSVAGGLTGTVGGLGLSGLGFGGL